MIITDEIKSLVQSYQNHPNQSTLKQLIQTLQNNLEKPEVKALYQTLHNTQIKPKSYPIKDNYAQAFCPIEETEQFLTHWKNYGFVVGKQVISKELQTRSRNRISQMLSTLSQQKFSLDDPKSWANIPTDKNKTPIISRGFFDVCHDEILADIRQSIRMYIHHVLIWGRVDLWTSFDRLGVKLPDHPDSKGLPLHVDQNPNVHPNFKTLQGVLALSDCPVERGTFFVVPGSRKYFSEYAAMADNNGEYVELDMAKSSIAQFQNQAQAIPLRAGDIVSWDSRTTHANTANISNNTRMVAYVAAGPAREDNLELIQARSQAFKTGEGKNVREALMHASKPPRFEDLPALAAVRQPETLTLLGELLYGQRSYKNYETLV